MHPIRFVYFCTGRKYPQVFSELFSRFERNYAIISHVGSSLVVFGKWHYTTSSKWNRLFAYFTSRSGLLAALHLEGDVRRDAVRGLAAALADLRRDDAHGDAAGLRDVPLDVVVHGERVLCKGLAAALDELFKLVQGVRDLPLELSANQFDGAAP